MAKNEVKLRMTVIPGRLVGAVTAASIIDTLETMQLSPKERYEELMRMLEAHMFNVSGVHIITAELRRLSPLVGK